MPPAHVEISILPESAASMHRSTRGHLDLMGSLGRRETGLPGLWIPGPIEATISEYVRESNRTLNKTYGPKVAIVVCPGRLDLGISSVNDIHRGTVEVGELAGAMAGRTV